VKKLSLDELDSCFEIINDPKNSVSIKFDGFYAFNEPAMQPSMPLFGASSDPDLDTLPRTAAIRITMLSLRFDDYSELSKSNKKALYLYKIAAEFQMLVQYKLPKPNAPTESAFRKSAVDRRDQIKLIKNQVTQLVVKIQSYELKNVAEQIIKEVLLITTPEESSILDELLLSLLSFGFDKVLDGVLHAVSGAAKGRLLDALTNPNGVLSGLMSKSGTGVLFDGEKVYDFLSKEDTFFESGMKKTLHSITTKYFADPESAVKHAASSAKAKKIQQADELRNLLIDYIEVLNLNLLKIQSHVDLVFNDGMPTGSLQSQGDEQLTDDGLDALYLFVFGYDYEGIINQFITDYTRNLKDIGLVEDVAGDAVTTMGFKDYRVATWLVWKSRAYLVLADVPFGRTPLPVRVYNAIPSQIKAAALKKTELAIANADDDFHGKTPILYASSPPLIPLDAAYSIDEGDLRYRYTNMMSRTRLDYPPDKPGTDSP